MKNVTSFDVAKSAGVSQPTVSRALRNLPGTSEATRERVLRAAQELAYIPSDSGRVLSARSSRRIAIVSEELTNPYYPELVEPLRRALAQHGYRTVIVTETPGGTVGLDVLADGSYDGVILTTTTRRSSLPRDLTERGVPHVLANRTLDEPESSSCSVDNEAGATAISDLLVGLGHERIASIQGPVLTSTGRERGLWLTRRLRQHGVSLTRELVARAPFTYEGGHDAARIMLQLPDPPTAVVCGNDVIAFGVLSTARELGVDVPGELTVIGFDDVPMSAWPIVGLTTVSCDLEALAITAIDLLMAELDGKGAGVEQRRTPTSLVLRNTHAPPRLSR